MFTAKVTNMGMRAYRLQLLTNLVAQIADVDSRLGRVFATTQSLAKDMKGFGDNSYDLRNMIIKTVVAKEKTFIEPLLEERRKVVQNLLGAIAKAHGKGMKELKEDLGLPA